MDLVLTNTAVGRLLIVVFVAVFEFFITLDAWRVPCDGISVVFNQTSAAPHLTLTCFAVATQRAAYGLLQYEDIATSTGKKGIVFIQKLCIVV